MTYLEDGKPLAIFRAVVCNGFYYDVRFNYLWPHKASAKSFCLWRDFYTALQNFCDTGHVLPNDSSNLFE